MKTSTLLLGALAGLASAAPSRRQDGGFAGTSGTEFTFGGATGYLTGSNSYWISMLLDDADVEQTMAHFAESGSKILRVWGFADVNAPTDNEVWFQSLSANGSTINEGPNGLPRLDAVVAAAEANGIGLIIPFVNYWDDYGGMAAYSAAFGGGAAEDFYTNEQSQAAYQSYIEAVVSRFKDSSAIFAWELANEPRCNGCETSVITEWARTTSAFVKELDPNHMVTLGDEGMGIAGNDTGYPYQFGEGTDFAANLEIETLDFGTFHMYPESWGMDLVDFPLAWIDAHAAACVAAGKPCLFEEYGSTENKCEIAGPWQAAMIETEGIAGDQFWQWGEEGLSSGVTHDDGYAVYYGDSAEYQCMVVDHIAAAAA